VIPSASGAVELPSGDMEIIGVGVDLAQVERVRGLLEKSPEAFRRRCYTDHEWEYAHRYRDPSERLAARFAGKEAVMKSLFTGWRRIPWTDIEITGGGPPRVRLYGRARQRADMLGVTDIMISITHTRETAMVFVISQGVHP
jgi:holo-[acyl-carrier protein] synthase